MASTSQSSRSRLSVIGVVYRDQMGRFHHAMVRENGEVMLAAGALGKSSVAIAEWHWSKAIPFFLGNSCGISSSICGPIPL